LGSSVDAAIDWYRLAGSGVRILRQDLPENFLASPDARTTLCGPMHLVRRKKRGTASLCWLPVFLVHTKTRREQDSIHFELDGEVQVNLSWLEAQFAGGDEDLRDDFLIRLGFLQEEQNGKLQSVPLKNFAQIWDALEQRVPEIGWVKTQSLMMPPRRQDTLFGARRAGLYPTVLMFKEELSPFSKGLITDLRFIAKAVDKDLAACSLAHLIEEPSPDPDISLTLLGQKSPVAELSSLNPSQFETVSQAMVAPLTVVQGPPGTGKSTVVRSALVSLGVNGQSAIFASTNHRAVEAVVTPMSQLASEGALVADVRKSDSDSRWSSILLANLGHARPNDASFLSEFNKSLVQLEQRVDSYHNRKRMLIEIGDDLLELEETLEVFLNRFPEWTEHLAEVDLGVDLQKLISYCNVKGHSTSVLDRVVLTFGRWRILRDLRSQLANPNNPPRFAMPDLLKAKVASIRRMEVLNQIRQGPSHEEVTNLLASAVDEKVSMVQKAVPRFAGCWASRARSLPTAISELRREFRGGGRSALDRRKEVEGRRLVELLPGLPVWAVTNLSVPRAVPRVAGAFDLAIVDEAGQCNPASVLPLLFRAKRAMFVGDPKQLRPIGQLQGHKEEFLRRKYGLEGVNFSRFAFSGRSAYDLAQDALVVRKGRPRLLKEHYRCHPAIAAFINRNFYDGNLLVRTTGQNKFGQKAGISWTHVKGESVQAGSSRWSPLQVTAIVNELRALAERGFEGSVGVVTPFREQAKRVRDAAFAALGARQAGKWDLISETADGFQGGERDLVLFSLVGGGSSTKPTPSFYLRDRNRFNVAVSRAKLHLHVFGDEEWAKSCDVPVLIDLAETATASCDETHDGFRTDLIGPVWEPLLADALRAAGLDFRQQYPACGFYLDFGFLMPDGRKVAVEVDGETYHRDRNGNLREEDIRRDLLLTANGWQVKRFWVYQLREDLEACIREIQSSVQINEK
jgi:very-short-patch-repair endonuclease